MKFEPMLEVLDVDDDADFRQFASSACCGLRFVPEPQYGGAPPSLKADFGDFAKWLRSQHPELPIDFPVNTPKIALHGADIWLPLVFLAGDSSMQVFLNMVASYLYDKARGNLMTDTARVHMAVVYEDKKKGTIKRFEFAGDREALATAIKRFDLDNFFDESP